jgi:hypothetical protein
VTRNGEHPVEEVRRIVLDVPENVAAILDAATPEGSRSTQAYVLFLLLDGFETQLRVNGFEGLAKQVRTAALELAERELGGWEYVSGPRAV